MFRLNLSMPTGSIGRRRLTFVGLMLLLCLGLPGTALADSVEPESAGPDPCGQCHSDIAEVWQSSPHAHAWQTANEAVQDACDQGATVSEEECLTCHTTGVDPNTHTYSHAGVTCQACHGEYVEGHPADGVMDLRVDSSACQNCHDVTSQEWGGTAHAEAGVQCISCHQVHSQEMRLSEIALCGSCHGDQTVTFEHTAHYAADLACDDCHLTPHQDTRTVADRAVMSGSIAPNHSFQPGGEACVSCHGADIHQRVIDQSASNIDSSQLVKLTERAQELARKLDDVERANRSLRVMSVVSLGFGLGAGGVLGIIFIAALCRFTQERLGQ